MKSLMRNPGFWKGKIEVANNFDDELALSGVAPRKLPFDQFLKTFELVPRIAVNLLVTRNDGAILLTRRKKPPFAGSWHMPGSFLLKSEPLMDCVHRVARQELGVDVTDIELAGVFDDLAGDPRGHVVDVVYRCKIDRKNEIEIEKGRKNSVGDTAEMRFSKKLPREVGFNHRDTLIRLGYR